MFGLMVVLALSLSAYYAYKTRSKIWRHGKANIYWDEPRVRTSEGQDVQDWVSNEVCFIIYFFMIVSHRMFEDCICIV